MRKERELEEENLRLCVKYLGKDHTNVCGPWAMKVCAREGFMLAGPYRSCYRATCGCLACKAQRDGPDGHSETETVQESCKDVGEVEDRDDMVVHAEAGNELVVHAEDCDAAAADGEGQETSQELPPKVNCCTEEGKKMAVQKDTTSWKRRRRRLKLKSAKRLV